MSEGIAIATAASLLAFGLSGARSTAYLFYYLAFVPFLTLDASAGGLTSLGGLGAGNVLFKLGFRAVTTLGLVVLIARRREALAAVLAPAHAPVILLCAWALLSLDRSPTPWLALLRLGELFTFFLTGVVLLLEAARFHPPRVVARWHCLALLQLPLVALYFAQRRPELAVHVDASGILRLGHKLLNANSLGFSAAVVLLWATYELFEPREHRRGRSAEQLLPLAALAVAVYVLLLARSRTALVAAVAGQLVLWLPLHAWDARRRAATTVLVLAGAALAMVHADAIGGWFLRGESVGELESASGRVELWRALFAERVGAAPVLGSGYLSLSESGTFAHAGRLWNNAHNTYVFALVSNGVPGLVLVVLAVALPWRALFERTVADPQPGWRLLLAVATVVGLVGLTEFGVSGYPNPVMLVHFGLYAYALSPGAAYGARRERQDAPELAVPRNARAVQAGGAGGAP